jgi:hypothetical protein
MLKAFKVFGESSFLEISSYYIHLEKYAKYVLHSNHGEEEDLKPISEIYK